MTEEIRNKILNTISEIQSLDIQECLSKTLPSNQSLEDRKVWVFNGITIIPVIERAVLHMKAFLESDEYLVHMNSNFGQTPIENSFLSLSSALKSGNYSGLVSPLQSVITYEIFHGIWDRGNVNIFDVNEIDVAKKKSELSTLISRVNKAKKDYETHLAEINNELAAKKSELAAITANKTSSDSELKQIRDAFTEAKSVISKYDKDFSAECAKILEAQRIHQERLREITEIQGKLDNQLSESQNIVNSLLSKETEIDSYKNEIKGYKDETAELVSLISSAGLSGAFKSRAGKLSSTVKWWFWGIWVGIVLSCIWIGFSFTKIPNFLYENHADLIEKTLIKPSEKTSVEYPALEQVQTDTSDSKNEITIFSLILFAITSGAKIFPVYLLMSFIFKQYSRERKTQEAYEFKAAVSATINSFANLLVEQKYGLTQDNFRKNGQVDNVAWEKYVGERDNYRRELIRTTVLNLYKEIDLEERHTELINEKNLNLFNKFLETVKSLKS